jgi:hypothetical protein
VRQQLRRVRYSTTRAESVLQYRPVVSFEQSTTTFRTWYSEALGWDTPSWPLLKELYS